MNAQLVRSRRALVGTALAGVAGIVLGAVAARAADDDRNKAAIEAIVHDYILAHPEIIPEAMDRLQANNSAKAIAADRPTIEKPFAGAWAGNPKGDVTLVMFTDYSCGYCRASAPDIAKLLAEDPKLKVVWREIPVLGPQSEVAAREALAAAKEGHYLAFHQALFAGGHPDAKGMAIAARAANLDPRQLQAGSTAPDVVQEVGANLALASRLQINATPTFIIGDKLYAGAIGHDALAKAIAEVRKPQ